jgi:hypothetical protein
MDETRMCFHRAGGHATLERCLVGNLGEKAVAVSLFYTRRFSTDLFSSTSMI